MDPATSSMTGMTTQNLYGPGSKGNQGFDFTFSKVPKLGSTPLDAKLLDTLEDYKLPMIFPKFTTNAEKNYAPSEEGESLAIYFALQYSSLFFSWFLRFIHCNRS